MGAGHRRRPTRRLNHTPYLETTHWGKPLTIVTVVTATKMAAFCSGMSDKEITQTACESVKMYSYEVSLKRNRPVFLSLMYKK